MTSPSPRITPIAPALEASVHVLGVQGSSVVIIDDQETARHLLDEMIRGIDPCISTILFASAIEALAWLEQHEPDLIITDYRMPGMTGAQLSSRLRQSRRLQHIPVMVITGTDDRAVRYEALEAGAVDFLAKPIDPLEIRTRCRNLLLLTRQYRLLKNYSLLQERKLDQLQTLLRSLTGDAAQKDAAQNLGQRTAKGESVTVAYDKLFALTTCVAGVQELVVAAQRYITDLEGQLTKPLRGTKD